MSTVICRKMLPYKSPAGRKKAPMTEAKYKEATDKIQRSGLGCIALRNKVKDAQRKLDAENSRRGELVKEAMRIGNILDYGPPPEPPRKPCRLKDYILEPAINPLRPPPVEFVPIRDRPNYKDYLNPRVGVDSKVDSNADSMVDCAVESKVQVDPKVVSKVVSDTDCVLSVSNAPGHAESSKTPRTSKASKSKASERFKASDASKKSETSQSSAA